MAVDDEGRAQRVVEDNGERGRPMAGAGEPDDGTRRGAGNGEHDRHAQQHQQDVAQSQ